MLMIPEAWQNDKLMAQVRNSCTCLTVALNGSLSLNGSACLLDAGCGPCRRRRTFTSSTAPSWSPGTAPHWWPSQTGATLAPRSTATACAPAGEALFQGRRGGSAALSAPSSFPSAEGSQSKPGLLCRALDAPSLIEFGPQSPHRSQAQVLCDQNRACHHGLRGRRGGHPTPGAPAHAPPPGPTLHTPCQRYRLDLMILCSLGLVACPCYTHPLAFLPSAGRAQLPAPPPPPPRPRL